MPFRPSSHVRNESTAAPLHASAFPRYTYVWLAASLFQRWEVQVNFLTHSHPLEQGNNLLSRSGDNKVVFPAAALHFHQITPRSRLPASLRFGTAIHGCVHKWNCNARISLHWDKFFPVPNLFNPCAQMNVPDMQGKEGITLYILYPFYFQKTSRRVPFLRKSRGHQKAWTNILLINVHI